MVFSSPVFLWLFLPTTCALTVCAGKRFANAVLLLASLLFYAWGEPIYVLLMLGCIAVSWTAGRGVLAWKADRPIASKAALGFGIAVQMAALLWFKYAGFVVGVAESLLHWGIAPLNIRLPIGISFFTFQAVSYLVDLWRGDAKESPSMLDTALYIAFFPQLIAGPIVQYRQISAQLRERSITAGDFALGFRRLIIGLSKKVLIANVVGRDASLLFSADASTLSSAQCWLAALLYAVQIYYDFSGYSDMAIGLGRMFGFRLPENFRLPYLSRSVSEFWRRWHITLGAWFRDYVYIPLGGSRRGLKRTCLNLLAVFLLTGVWHGAGFTFMAWGLWFALLVMAEKLFLGRWLEKHRLLSHFYLLLAVLIGWVLFSSVNLGQARAMLTHMLMPWKYGVGTLTLIPQPKTLLSFLAGVLGAGVLQRLIPQRLQRRWKESAVETVLLIGLLLLCVASLSADSYNPFIYFQF